MKSETLVSACLLPAIEDVRLMEIVRVMFDRNGLFSLLVVLWEAR